MIRELEVDPQSMSNCSITLAGDTLFVCTSQGRPGNRSSGEAIPSLIALDRRSGRLLWTDSTSTGNILRGQWSSPAFGIVQGEPQVVFGGGDGFVYGFSPEGKNGKAELLWKFDCNPKRSKYQLGQNSERCPIIATPVIYDEQIYVAVGDNPEIGEGKGRLWCIRPTHRGDVSPTLVYNRQNPEQILPHKRTMALDERLGDFEEPNEQSAVVWLYEGTNPNFFNETMHRTLASVAIQSDLLFVPDFSGLLHCLNAKTGEVHWTHDLLGYCWSTPLIVGDKVYVATEEGQMHIFERSSTKKVIAGHTFDSPIYSTPVVANETLYVATQRRLYAIGVKP